MSWAVPWRRIQRRRVVLSVHQRRVEADTSGSHTVVLREDQLLRPIRAVGGFVLALDDWEGVENVVGVVSGDPVQMEEQRIQLRPDNSPPLLIPPKRRAN